MTLSNIITFDLLSHYDSKLKQWIKNLKASLTEDGLMAKEDFAKLSNIETGAQANVLEGVLVNGSNLVIDANKKVNIEVPTDFYSKGEVDAKDTSVLENVLGKLWSNKKGDNTGNFQTKYEHQDGSYAQMWNESDGGGSQYYNKESNVISYVGVNNGAGNDVYAQIYAKNKVTNTGVRINVTPTGAYYNVTNGINNDPRYEIATKGDIIAVQGEVPSNLSEFTNDANFLTATEIEQRISAALTSVITYKGSVATVEDLPSENVNNGDMYNVQGSDHNYIYNGEGWDIMAPIITIETATEAQIESLFA